MIFVDTGAWFASVITSDPNHSAAQAWLNSNIAPLLTTDYVVDETLTLLRARRHHTKARWLGERFFNSQLGAIYHLTEDDLRRAWETFRDFDDKEWSFTDCASRVVIEKFNIAKAFAFDHHFRQLLTIGRA